MMRNIRDFAATLGVAICVLATVTAADAAPPAERVKDRNLGNARPGATAYPRSEGDQALVNGWPMYRTERAQTAFNDVMATLHATDGPAPAQQAFKGCVNLDCALALPPMGSDGWIPPGRLWVSPNDYVLIAHSPRLVSSRGYRLRMRSDMRYFVYHEFQNSSRNTDVFDTISAHKGSVFVPLYMSKQGTDARGKRFVVVVQVAPYNVQSIHASNYGSAGPGMEVAKNSSDELQPLQALAGVLIGTLIKAAAPQLQVVSHHGVEGRPMLEAYQRRLSYVQSHAGIAPVTLPFTAATVQRVAVAAANLEDIITRPGLSPRIPLAQRGFLPSRAPSPSLVEAVSSAEPVVTPAAFKVPTPSPALSPLAVYLRSYLNTLRLQPAFARIIPSVVASIGVASPETNVVYLLDRSDQIVGRIEPFRENGREVAGMFVAATTGATTPFQLDLTRPPLLQASATAVAEPPLLLEPTRPAPRPGCANGAAPAGVGCR